MDWIAFVMSLLESHDGDTTIMSMKIVIKKTCRIFSHRLIQIQNEIDFVEPFMIWLVRVKICFGKEPIAILVAGVACILMQIEITSL